MVDDSPREITIPLAEYRALKACRARLQALERNADVPVNPGYGAISPIDRDPELADFIREHLGKLPLIDIAAECRKRFGPNRAPSKTAIHRFWQRLNALRSPQALASNASD